MQQQTNKAKVAYQQALELFQQMDIQPELQKTQKLIDSLSSTILEE